VRDFISSYGVPWEIEREDTYTIVKETLEPGKTTCSLCSRLRRGIMYNAAPRLGCNKIALGHHRDDSVETFLLNVFFSGRVCAMPPKLLSDDGRNVLIRPLSYAAEEDIAAYARERGFPTVPCKLCDEQPDLQRRRIGELVDGLERDFPHVRSTILKATADVRRSQLLDRNLWDFKALVSKHRPGEPAAPKLPRKLTVLP
jgi:tRNA 2-thiocytidine biosynthesis protein TtcA